MNVNDIVQCWLKEEKDINPNMSLWIDDHLYRLIKIDFFFLFNDF